MPGTALEPTDEVLLVRFRRGDDQAFGTLFERHRDSVLSFSHRLLGSRPDAEEICVEAFSRLVTHGEGVNNPRAFVFTVAHRLCIDRLRRRKRAVRATERLAALEATQATSPEGAAVAAERSRRLASALQDLPDAHRSALLLYYGEDLRASEVAEILGWQRDQVRSRVAYACKLLKQALRPAEED